MGGKSPSTVTQTSTTQMSPQQQAIFNTAFPMAQTYAQTPIQTYAGSGVADFAPAEAQAQQQLTTAAGTANSLARQSANAQSMLLNPDFMLNPESNPFLKSQAEQLAAGLTQNLTQNQLPSIRSGATVSGGQYSGGATRQGVAEGRAISGTNDSISNGIADLMFNAYNRGLTGMEGAVNNNANVQAQQGVGAEMLGAVGGQQRSMEQAKLDEEISKFYTNQALPLLQSQQLMSLLTGMPGGTATSTATGTTPSPNPFSAGMGGALSGAALGSLVPGLGTGVGALGGGLLSLLLNK